jgi:hypothetical protein
MAATDALLIVGVVVGVGGAYITNIGGFKTWLDAQMTGSFVDAYEKTYPNAGRAPPPQNPLVSTLCKCGTGTAKHVVGDCNACKSTCVATCGNCTPQCMGTRSNLAFAQSYASYPMKGLIVS